MTALIDLLILQSRQIYMKLRFPHNVPLKKKWMETLMDMLMESPLLSLPPCKAVSHSYTVCFIAFSLLYFYK